VGLAAFSVLFFLSQFLVLPLTPLFCQLKFRDVTPTDEACSRQRSVVSVLRCQTSGRLRIPVNSQGLHLPFAPLPARSPEGRALQDRAVDELTPRFVQRRIHTLALGDRKVRAVSNNLTGPHRVIPAPSLLIPVRATMGKAGMSWASLARHGCHAAPP